jgi:hypothetical protein
MKKKLLLMAIILPFILSSCGDDKDILSYQEEKLVGEWAIVNTLETPSDDYHYVFKKERSGSRRHLENGNVVSDISFFWTLDGNRLTLDYGAGQQLVMDITINNDILQMTYLGTGVTENYKKVVNSDD